MTSLYKKYIPLLKLLKPHKKISKPKCKISILSKIITIKIVLASVHETVGPPIKGLSMFKEVVACVNI